MKLRCQFISLPNFAVVVVVRRSKELYICLIPWCCGNSWDCSVGAYSIWGELSTFLQQWYLPWNLQVLVGYMLTNVLNSMLKNTVHESYCCWIFLKVYLQYILNNIRDWAATCREQRNHYYCSSWNLLWVINSYLECVSLVWSLSLQS